MVWHFVALKIHEISKLSNADFVSLVATYNQALDGRPDADLTKRGYSKEQIAAVNEALKKEQKVSSSLGLRFSVSLKKFRFEPFDYVLSLFYSFERGVLPFSGSLSDQPAQIIDIFNTLQALRSEREEAQRKQLESKNGRHQRKDKPRGAR